MNVVSKKADQPKSRLRYSVSLVRQGKHQFYTLTMPSEVLARTCKVTTRGEDPKNGFQRELDVKRADEISRYIDEGLGTIPNSIVLSAQPEAELKVVGKGKTVEFNDQPGAFLILDGQHRVFGFSKAKTSLRVPVVIYNGLSRAQESRLFIDINTKQRPVPPPLLLDIKKLAELELEDEGLLREIFDYFHEENDSALKGLLTPYESAKGKLTRVTFNSAIKPLLTNFADQEAESIYRILNSYLTAIAAKTSEKASEPVLSKPVIFRAVIGLFPMIAQRVKDKFNREYSASNFAEIISPLFANLPRSKLANPGSSWVQLRDYLERRLREKAVF